MKRKVWDITVKGSMNRVAMGENDEFYTTDTEAFLVFNLQDKFFMPQSAMITLENRNDGSLKSEEVEVVGGKIKWEMPERYIEHFGNWQVQIVYETKESGQIEKYTSGVMSFNVNSHIGDKKKPSLVEIENWEKFIREGTELIETWEDLEALREENERQRGLNEQARESAESVRVANEEERELNEAERISKDSERDSKIEEIERVATEILKPIHTLKVENEVFSSDEVSVSEGVITINNHNLNVGDKVAFVATATPYNVSESFEGPMRLNTVYYVVNVSSDSFQISTTQNGEPIIFNVDTKGFLWQFEKVNVQSLVVSGLDGTKYRAIFTGSHDGSLIPRRLLYGYTNPGNVAAFYSTEDDVSTITATDINPVHGVTDVYSEMIFKVINRKILIDVISSFTIIGGTTDNHREETYRNRIITKTTQPSVGFQDSINRIGIGGRHLFDGSTLEVYEV